MKTGSETVTILVGEKFSRLGINKSRELARLVYELSQIKKRSPAEILAMIDETAGYKKAKAQLVKERYPEASREAGLEKNLYFPPLPKVHSEALKDDKFSAPRKIIAEKKSLKSPVFKRISEICPAAEVEIIEKLSLYNAARQYTTEDYNRRRETFFVVEELYDFIKACPCTKGCLCCGYYVLNAGFGCPFECSYCFLQEYTNSPGIIIPSNINKYLESIPAGFTGRISTGEFSDSLALDRYTDFSRIFVTYFAKRPEICFEFKSKSSDISSLLSLSPAFNAVLSWSLNPENIIMEHEFLTASLKERLDAAAQAVSHGYRTGFHLDPVIVHDGWEKNYFCLVETLAEKIRADRVAWISIGTLRFPPALKKNIESRFPDSTLLHGELIKGFDGKLRYPEPQRVLIYKKLYSLIKSLFPEVPVYLCMESREIWERAGLNINETLLLLNKMKVAKS